MKHHEISWNHQPVIHAHLRKCDAAIFAFVTVCSVKVLQPADSSEVQAQSFTMFYRCGPHLLGLFQRCHKPQPLLCLHLGQPSVFGAGEQCIAGIAVHLCIWKLLHLVQYRNAAGNIGLKKILNRIGITVKSSFKPPLPRLLPLLPPLLLPLLPIFPLPVSPAPHSLALPLQSAPPAPAGFNDGQVKEIPCLPYNSAQWSHWSHFHSSTAMTRPSSLMSGSGGRLFLNVSNIGAHQRVFGRNYSIYIYTYMHARIHTYIHTSIHTYTYIPTYLPAYIHTYIHTYVRTYVRTYVHTLIHTYINTYIHTYITLHYITLHYITLHYITLHYITLHYITLHYITYIHYHYIPLHTITYHYIPLHTITYHYIPLHTITYHYIPLHTITYHYIPLHHITLHYIALHCITLHYIHTYIHPSIHPCMHACINVNNYIYTTVYTINI